MVHLVVDDQPVASLALADVIRPESREAVERLHAMGVQVAMLTGDSQAVAKAVADELGIDTVLCRGAAGGQRQEGGRAASRRASAWPWLAMGSTTRRPSPAPTWASPSAAAPTWRCESAGIILVKNNPLDVVKVIALSRASYRKMIQNLLWATGYNVVALPLAAGVLAPWGILLSPAAGAVLMSLSTIIVAINAQTLRRQTLVG